MDSNPLNSFLIAKAHDKSLVIKQWKFLVPHFLKHFGDVKFCTYVVSGVILKPFKSQDQFVNSPL